MAGFAERFINAYEAGNKSGTQRRTDETIQKFGTLASQGDQQAMDQIYGVDPGAAAQLETQFSNRNKSNAEWDNYVQEQAGRVAHSVLTAPAEQRAQRVASGIDFMTGLTRRDPRFKTVIDGWRQKLQAGDMPGIESELNAVLERTMGFKEKYAGDKLTGIDGALAQLYPDPNDRARARIEMETGKDRYVTTPNGIMVIPGRMPSGMPGAPAPAGTKPLAAYTGGQQPPAGPRPSSAPGYASGPVVPNGGYIIEGTERPVPPATSRTLDEKRDRIRGSAQIVADAKGWLQKVEAGELDVGGLSNWWAENVQNPSGNSSEFSRNLASFTSFVEGLRNRILQLNAGPQTDSDAQRAMDEILRGKNDKGVIQQRLNDLIVLYNNAKGGFERDYEMLAAEAGMPEQDVQSFSSAINTPYKPSPKPAPAAAPAPPPAPAPAPTRSLAPPQPAGAPRPLPMVGEDGRPIAGPAGPSQMPTQQDRAAQWQAAVQQYARQHNISPEQANVILLRRAQQRTQQQ